jgi:hypothetical protein
MVADNIHDMRDKLEFLLEYRRRLNLSDDPDYDEIDKTSREIHAVIDAIRSAKEETG